MEALLVLATGLWEAPCRRSCPRFCLGRSAVACWGRGSFGLPGRGLGDLSHRGERGHVGTPALGAGAVALLPWSCPCRGGHPRRLQDQDGHLRDTSEPGGPHVRQLSDLAAVRGGETLYWLLQHQQRQVPAVPRAPPQCQGEPWRVPGWAGGLVGPVHWGRVRFSGARTEAWAAAGAWVRGGCSGVAFSAPHPRPSLWWQTAGCILRRANGSCKVVSHLGGSRRVSPSGPGEFPQAL